MKRISLMGLMASTLMLAASAKDNTGGKIDDTVPDTTPSAATQPDTDMPPAPAQPTAADLDAQRKQAATATGEAVAAVAKDLPAGSEGAKAVGYVTNLGKDENVDQMKHAAAMLIDSMITLEKTSGSDRQQFYALTARQAFEEAVMWAEKALTWKD